MENLAVLEALERGVVAAAPGVRREALRELREYRADTRREALALARGWEPWTPSEDIVFGLAEPPHRRWGWVLAGAFMCAAGVAAILVDSLAEASRVWLLLPGVMGGIVGGMMTTYQLSGDSQFRTATREQTGRASDGGDRYRVYRGALPVAAWELYQRERGLFDRVYVASQDGAAFEQRRAWVADPFLVGEIGRKLYLGAHWDLQAELGLAAAKGQGRIAR